MRVSQGMDMSILHRLAGWDLYKQTKYPRPHSKRIGMVWLGRPTLETPE